MKRTVLFFVILVLLPVSLFAQRTIQMHNIWIKPRVHVLFEGYTISFTVRDINKALELMAETGDSTYGLTSGLDTGKEYMCELYSGVRMQYRSPMQNLLQNGVGAFLITAGHAYIENPRHKQMQTVITDAQPFPGGVEQAFLIFTDPKNGQRLFTGRMSADMYNKDLGFE